MVVKNSTRVLSIELKRLITFRCIEANSGSKITEVQQEDEGRGYRAVISKTRREFQTLFCHSKSSHWSCDMLTDAIRI